MRKTLLFFVIFPIILTGHASAARMSFSEAVTAAQERLNSGEFDKALEILHELQVDHPDSGIVAYGIGKALYSRAQHQETLGAKDEAAASYGEAETVFSKISGEKDAKIAVESAFGRINAAARKALLVPADQKYEEAVTALRGAIVGYEQFLREHPGHAGAQKNLDHVRLKLKELQQNPQQPKKEDDKQKPPEDNKKQPMVYFLSAGTEIPKAQAKAEGNQLELVVPGGGEAKP
jgi:tetratricopeptide (TPR) repeat protein